MGGRERYAPSAVSNYAPEGWAVGSLVPARRYVTLKWNCVVRPSTATDLPRHRGWRGARVARGRLRNIWLWAAGEQQ